RKPVREYLWGGGPRAPRFFACVERHTPTQRNPLAVQRNPLAVQRNPKPVQRNARQDVTPCRARKSHWLPNDHPPPLGTPAPRRRPRSGRARRRPRPPAGPPLGELFDGAKQSLNHRLQ